MGLISKRLAQLLFPVLIWPAEAWSESQWPAHLAIELKGGNDRSLTRTSALVPAYQDDDALLFFNLVGMRDDRNNQEYSVGVGYRHLYDDWIIGGWGFYDRRRSREANIFNQLSFGFEALSDQWDWRFNAYFPDEESKRIEELNRVEYSPTSIQVRLGEQRALPGGDFELGYRLPFFEETRLFLAGYHFEASGYEHVTGARTRVESRFHSIRGLGEHSRLSVGVELSDDNLRDTQAYGYVRLRIPLGGKNSTKPLTRLQRRMTDSVTRDVDVITRTQLSRPITPFNPLTGERITGVVTLTGADNNAVNEAVTQQNEGTYFLVDGTVQTNETIELREGQAFIGGNFEVAYFDPNGGIGTLPVSPGSASATVISTNPSADVFHIPANVTSANVFQNIVISGGLDGISDPDVSGGGDNATQVYLRNVTIENVAGRGIDLGDLGFAQIEAVTVRNTGTDGMFFASENTVTIRDSLFEQTGEEALVFNNRNALTITDSTFRQTGGGQEGIQSGDDNRINLNRVILSDLTNDGMRIQDGNTLELVDVTIQNASGDGIQLDEGNTVQLSRVSISNTGAAGVAFVSDNEGVVENSNFEGAGLQGLIFSSGNDVVISSSNVRNTAREGIQIVNSNTITLSDVLIENSGSGATPRDAINVRGNGGANTLTFNDVTIRTATGDGIDLLDGNEAVFTNMDIEGVAENGLYIKGNGNTVTLDSSRFSSVGGNTLQIDDGNAALDGSGNTVDSPSSGADCVVNGATPVGAITFTDIAGGGPGTCP